MFAPIKNMFVILLVSIVSASNHTKLCMSLSNQKCMTQPTLINLHPNEYSQALRYYPFVVNLNRYLELAILLMTYPLSICSKLNRRFKLACF